MLNDMGKTNIGYLSHYNEEDMALMKRLNAYLIKRTGVAAKYEGMEHLHSYSDFSHHRYGDTERNRQIKQILSQHGIKDFDIQTGRSPTFEKIAAQIRKFKPHPKDDVRYPSYVSAYDTTRRFGGHHEGGWYYTWYEHQFSVKVHNRVQALRAAVWLYKTYASQADGKLTIVAEKYPKGMEKNQSQPEYR